MARFALAASFIAVAGATTMAIQGSLNQAARRSAVNPGPGPVFVSPRSTPAGWCLTDLSVSPAPSGVKPPGGQGILTLTANNDAESIVVFGPGFGDWNSQLTAGHHITAGVHRAFVGQQPAPSPTIGSRGPRIEWEMGGRRFSADGRGVSAETLADVVGRISYDHDTESLTYSGTGFTVSSTPWFGAARSSLREYTACTDSAPSPSGPGRLAVIAADLTGSPTSYWFPPVPFGDDTSTVTIHRDGRSLRAWKRVTYWGQIELSWAEGETGYWVYAFGLPEASILRTIEGLAAVDEAVLRRSEDQIKRPASTPSANGWIGLTWSPPRQDTAVLDEQGSPTPLTVEAGTLNGEICLRARVAKGVSQTQDMCADDLVPAFVEMRFTSTWRQRNRVDAAVVKASIATAEALLADGSTQSIPSAVDARFPQLRVFVRPSDRKDALPVAYRFFDSKGKLIHEQR